MTFPTQNGNWFSLKELVFHVLATCEAPSLSNKEIKERVLSYGYKTLSNKKVFGSGITTILQNNSWRDESPLSSSSHGQWGLRDHNLQGVYKIRIENMHSLRVARITIPYAKRVKIDDLSASLVELQMKIHYHEGVFK